MQATSEINVKEALQNDWNAVTFNFLSNIIHNRLFSKFINLKKIFEYNRYDHIEIS